MIKIEYIGPKADGERHMRAETGIEWFPGAVHEVSDAHGAEFLKHPTSWRAAEAKVKLADATPATPAPPLAPAPTPAPTAAPAAPKPAAKKVAAKTTGKKK